jgi:hypothetical protein
MSDYDKAMLTALVAVTATFISVIGSGVVAYLVSRWTTRANIETEEFKGLVRAEIEPELIRIKADFDQKQDALRHDLQRAAVVHEIKFRKLYDRVSTVVEDTFKHISDAYRRGGLLVEDLEWEGAPDKKKRYEDFRQAFDFVVAYVFENRIFLPKMLHDAVNRFMDPLRENATKFRTGWKKQERGGGGDDFWGEASDHFRKTIMPLYEELCTAMQVFIGLEERSASN